MALTDNIVAYYKFDADNSNDSVGSNNGTDTSMSYSSTAGKINDGASFNGTSSRIDVPSGIYNLFTGTSSWTVNFWINFQETTSSYKRAGFISSSTLIKGTYWGRASSGDSWTVFASRNNGAGDQQVNGTTNMSGTGTWRMLTIRYDGTNLKVAVNGTNEGSVASNNTMTAPTTGALGAGDDGAGGYIYLQCYQDEVGYWSRALTDGELTTLYNGGAGLQYPFSTGNKSNFLAFM